MDELDDHHHIKSENLELPTNSSKNPLQRIDLSQDQRPKAQGSRVEHVLSLPLLSSEEFFQGIQPGESLPAIQVKVVDSLEEREESMPKMGRIGLSPLSPSRSAAGNPAESPRFEKSPLSGPTLSRDSIAGSGAHNVSERAKLWGPKLWRTLFYILMWYLFSMCLSLYNKFLLGNKHGHFPAPLLMTTIHFLMQYCIAVILLKCVCVSWAPPKKLTWKEYVTRVVPTAVVTAGDIGLSNLSLAMITLTFYTMCKASAPVFLLLFAFAFSLESPSVKLLTVILIISAGVLLTVAGETEFDVIGFFLVMFASVMSGLRWVLLQVLLQKEKLGMTNPLVTLSYLTPVMAFLCFTLSFFVEPWHTLLQSSYFNSWHNAGLSLAVMFVGGCLAFFMIMTEFLLISETSAVSFSVAGTVKEGITIIVSHFVFHDKFTKWNTIGLLIMIFGVSMFNVYKIQRMKDGSHIVHPKAVRDFEAGDPEEEKCPLVGPTEQVHGAGKEIESKEKLILSPRTLSSPSLSPRDSPSPVRSISSPRPPLTPRAVEALKEVELSIGVGPVIMDDGMWKSPRGLSSPGSAGLHERKT